MSRTVYHRRGALANHVQYIDGADLPVAEKMARYYGQAGKGGSDGPFCFETLLTRFELAGPDIFTEVLRPQTIWNLVA